MQGGKSDDRLLSTLRHEECGVPLTTCDTQTSLLAHSPRSAVQHTDGSNPQSQAREVVPQVIVPDRFLFRL